MNDFYKKIKEYYEDESKDNNKYLELAAIAPTVKAKKILTDIAREEAIHHKFLKEILDDANMDEEDLSNKSDNKVSEDKESTKYTTNRKIDYQTHIENAGVDPDLVK